MMRSSRYRRWHLDKIFVKINEVEHDLGRAVDQAGEFLESFVTKRRDKSAILKFLRKLLGRHGLVEATVTDHLASYGAAMKTLCIFEKARGRAQVLQACREFPPNLPTPGAGHASLSVDPEFAEIRRVARLFPQ
jgi:transposase-like protein